jgi:hypothetical protein
MTFSFYPGGVTMEKTVNLTLRVSETLHKKMKILAAVKGENMSSLFCGWLEKQKLNIPDFGEPEIKRKTVKPGTRKDQNPDADEQVIKAEILKHHKAGLSLQKIADALNDAEIPTLRGGAQWVKGTISGLIKKYNAQGA